MCRRFWILAILTVLLVSCNSLEQQAWKVVESERDNYAELSHFLNHYKRGHNKEKYQAACFLIANMTNKFSIVGKHKERIYDIHVINADSLILSLDYSFALYDTCKHLHQYSFEDFCEYVLPYRIANEPLSYYWKWDIPRWLGVKINESDEISELARKINRKVDVYTMPEAWGNPQMGYTATMSGQIGKCDDRTILAAMAMRSMGIPAAFDFIPAWGSNNNGHSVCTVILPKDRILVFQDQNDSGEDVFLSQKTPKIYRRMYAQQNDIDISKIPEGESLSPLFSNFNLSDVTAFHSVGQCNMELPIDSRIQGRLIYLSVFSPKEWIPVAYGKKGNSGIEFPNVGNGTNKSGYDSAKGENIGEGILYLPSLFEGNAIHPASAPIIVSSNGIRTIFPGAETERVVLTRKYPRLNRVIKFADQMVGGVFEGACNADFSDAIILHYVLETPLSRLQRVQLSASKPLRFIRYRKPQGVFSIGEICVYDKTGKQLKGRPISDPAIAQEKGLQNIYDNDPLTYYEVNGGIDLWAGLAFDSPQSIAYLEFCPRNDDNEMTPGDEYELFYWDDGWESLGVQVATGYELVYENVPQGALLWLRNLTKGHEERPFTYENNVQIWH